MLEKNVLLLPFDIVMITIRLHGHCNEGKSKACGNHRRNSGLN